MCQVREPWWGWSENRRQGLAYEQTAAARVSQRTKTARSGQATDTPSLGDHEEEHLGLSEVADIGSSICCFPAICALITALLCRSNICLTLLSLPFIIVGSKTTGKPWLPQWIRRFQMASWRNKVLLCCGKDNRQCINKCNTAFLFLFFFILIAELSSLQTWSKGAGKAEEGF